MRARRLSYIIAILLTITACKEENEFSMEYQCRFFFDTNIHNTSIIKNALNPMATGIFVSVSQNWGSGGARTIHAELNDGRTLENVDITTARETAITYVMGANNGLLIGYSLLGNGLFAFDKQCPNCLKEFNQANYPMDWDNSGMYVKCKKCGRRYNLNNSGFCVDDGKARKLIRYRASYDGNILSVHN